MIRANRAFLVRAAQYVAEAGIRQVAYRVDADARVVYVDSDPVVIAHGRAFNGGHGIAVVFGDLRHPDDVLDRSDGRRWRPAPISCSATGVTALATTSRRSPTPTGKPTADVWMRTPEQIRACLTGLDLVEPALVPVQEWRPDPAAPPVDVGGRMRRCRGRGTRPGRPAVSDAMIAGFGNYRATITHQDRNDLGALLAAMNLESVIVDRLTRVDGTLTPTAPSDNREAGRG